MTSTLTAVAWRGCTGNFVKKWHVREFAWQSTTVCGWDLEKCERGFTEKPLADVLAKDCCKTCLLTLRKAATP